jgi:uncharacterized membrane protein YeiH
MARFWEMPEFAFSVSGTERALDFRLTPIAAVMMGAISGAGGYTIRDILLAEVPAVLRVDFLAPAAIIGAIVLVVARVSKRPSISRGSWEGRQLRPENRWVWQHWHLPTANLH